MTDHQTARGLSDVAIQSEARTTEPPRPAAQVAVLAAASLTIMAPAIIAPSLPAMTSTFGGAQAEVAVRLTLTVTSLAIAITAPIAGVVADRMGRRPVLLSGLLLYALAGTVGFFLTSLPWITTSRVLLGVAVGAITTAVTATIADWFTGPRRATFMGLQQAAASLGGIVFLTAAGTLAGVNWRAPFWLYAVAVAALVLAFITVKETSLVGTRPKNSATSAGPNRMGASAVGIYAVALVATIIFYMAPTQVPFLLSQWGAEPSITGLAIASSTVTSLLGALIFPRLRSLLTSTVITALGVTALGTGWLLIGLVGGPLGAFAGLLIGGFGVGIVVPNLSVRLGELAPAGIRGRVLAGLVTAIFLGQFLSPIAIQPAVAVAGISGAFTWTGAATLAFTLAWFAITRLNSATRVR